MKIEPQRLKAFLLDSSLVTKDQLRDAEARSKKEKKNLGDVLVSEKYVSREDILKLQAYILGIPFVNLEKETIPSDVLRIIPEPIARKNNVVAFRKDAAGLQVAMLDPDDLQTIEFIKKKSNLRILPRLTSPESIKYVLQQYQKSLEAEFGEIVKTDSGIKTVQEGEGGVEGDADLKKVAEELPIIRIVDTLLKHAIIQNASDIHIEPLEKEVVVRYRIDGILHDAMVLPAQVSSGIVARIKVLSNLKIDEHRLPQDGRFKVESEDYRVAFRVSILPVYDGEKVVLRLLPESSKGYTFESLGFAGEALEHIHKNIKKPLGMILVTGPTGSGKTTTLYTAMDILNTQTVNISSIEDPIEYRMPRINQTQVKPQIGLTFANGLRALVRQDPDIIMVGEIRDRETAALAINAALTGHLVLSTIHTNSAAGALPRLLEMGVEGFLVAATANVIIGQRLVRKLCEDREKYTLSPEDIKNFDSAVNLKLILEELRKRRIISEKTEIKDIEFSRPKETKKCPDGYKGRMGIYEVLPITETIRNLIIKGATPDEIENQARKEGMLTMFEDGFIKATQGLTSIEEVLRVTTE